MALKQDQPKKRVKAFRRKKDGSEMPVYDDEPMPTGKPIEYKDAWIDGTYLAGAPIPVYQDED